MTLDDLITRLTDIGETYGRHMILRAEYINPHSHGPTDVVYVVAGAVVVRAPFSPTSAQVVVLTLGL